MMKIKNIHEIIFNTRLLFVYDCNAIEAENHLNTKNIITNLRKCTGQTGNYIERTKEKQQSRYYMYIEKGNLTPEIIAHEVSHLCFMSLFDCGIKINQDTDEIFSYYIEWWIKEINKIIGIKSHENRKI